MKKMNEVLGINGYLLFGIIGLLVSIGFVMLGLRENTSNKVFFNVSRLLALLSVAGIWYFGNILTKNTTNEIEAAKLKSAEANEAAAVANSMAIVLESNLIAAQKETELAKQETEKVRLKVEETHKQSQQIEVKLEEQKVIAAQAEMDLIRLQEKVKPRAISSAEASLLISKLREFSIKEIKISSSLGDGEAISYANQIKGVFEAAGWKVDSGTGFSLYTGLGVFILVNTAGNPNAKAIKNIFNSAGINLQEQVMAEGADLQIFVGSKSTQ